jgi:cytochrome c biogenesis protein
VGRENWDGVVVAFDVADRPVEAADPTPPQLGIVGTLRYLWRLLTSMRTALILLFLLALAAVPGSVFPQRGVAPLRVRDFYVAHPGSAPIMDRLGMFDVYASPWFAAIYLLLLVSLAGCVIPRAAKQWRTVRAEPPVAPRNLSRMPEYQAFDSQRDAVAIVGEAAANLRGNRFRVVLADDGLSVSAEKGYTREIGNLIFHLALLVLLVGVALGSLFGYKGTVVVVEGEGFANTPTQYDDLTMGRAFRESNLPPFSFTLDHFSAKFVESGPKAGQPAGFDAYVTYLTKPGAQPGQADIRVNYPLLIDGSKIYLLSHGYAPSFTVRDGDGKVVFSGSVPFLPQDAKFTSSGVVKAPDAQPDQLGFNGIFLPTAYLDPQLGPISVSPDPKAPRVFLGAYAGDLGLDSGDPQSVYVLNTDNMTLIGRHSLAIGQTWKLPGERGSISFDGYKRFANFQVASDPGRQIVFWGAVLALIGLIGSLTIKRRRVWVRASTDPAGRTLVEVAALARSEGGDLTADVAPLVAVLAKSDEAKEEPT